MRFCLSGRTRISKDYLLLLIRIIVINDYVLSINLLMRVTISKEYLSTVKTLICFSISNHKMDKICLPLDISRALTFLGSLLCHFIRFLLFSLFKIATLLLLQHFVTFPCFIFPPSHLKYQIIILIILLSTSPRM